MNIFQEGWKNFKSLFTSSKYVSFKGCTSRREFWTTEFIIVLISICLFILDIVISPNLLLTNYFNRATASSVSVGYFFNIRSVPILSTLFLLVIFLPQISMSVRRLHDTGHSGWFLFISSILMFVAILFLLPSTYYFALEGAVLVSLILTSLFSFAAFIFNIVVFVFLVSRGVTENNIYKNEKCCLETKVVNNQSVCCCGCDKKNETQVKDNKSDNNTDSISQE